MGPKHSWCSQDYFVTFSWILNPIPTWKGQFLRSLFIDPYLFHNEFLAFADFFFFNSRLLKIYIHINMYICFFSKHNEEDTENVLKTVDLHEGEHGGCARTARDKRRERVSSRWTPVLANADLWRMRQRRGNVTAGAGRATAADEPVQQGTRYRRVNFSMRMREMNSACVCLSLLVLFLFFTERTRIRARVVLSCRTSLFPRGDRSVWPSWQRFSHLPSKCVFLWVAKQIRILPMSSLFISDSSCLSPEVDKKRVFSWHQGLVDGSVWCPSLGFSHRLRPHPPLMSAWSHCTTCALYTS